MNCFCFCGFVVKFHFSHMKFISTNDTYLKILNFSYHIGNVSIPRKLSQVKTVKNPISKAAGINETAVIIQLSTLHSFYIQHKHACILYTTKKRPCQVLKDAYKRIRLNFEKDIISLMSKCKEYQSFAPVCILECRLTCCTVHPRKIKRHLIPQVSVMHATSELQGHGYFSPLLKPLYPLGFTCQTLV